MWLNFYDYDGLQPKITPLKTFYPAVYLCLKLLYSSLLKQWTLNYLDKKVPHCVSRFITLPLIYWIWTQKCKSEVYFQELLQFIPPFVLKWNTTPIPNAIQNLFFSLIKNITHKPSPKQNSKNLSPQPIIPKTYQFLPCGLQIILLSYSWWFFKIQINP